MKPKQWIRLIILLFSISFGCILVGSLFKIQHWPTAGIFITIGVTGNIIASLIGLIYAIRLILKNKNKPNHFLQ